MQDTTTAATTATTAAGRRRTRNRIAAAVLAAAAIPSIALSPATDDCTTASGGSAAQGRSGEERHYFRLDDDAPMLAPTGTMTTGYPSKRASGTDHVIVTRSGVPEHAAEQQEAGAHGGALPPSVRTRTAGPAVFTGSFVGRLETVEFALWTPEPGRPGNNHLWVELTVDGLLLHRGDVPVFYAGDRVDVCHRSSGRYSLSLTEIADALDVVGADNTTTTRHHVTVAFAPPTSRAGSQVELFGIDTWETPSHVVFEPSHVSELAPRTPVGGRSSTSRRAPTTSAGGSTAAG